VPQIDREELTMLRAARSGSVEVDLALAREPAAYWIASLRSQ